jgi:hypothetical protein
VGAVMLLLVVVLIATCLIIRKLNYVARKKSQRSRTTRGQGSDSSVGQIQDMAQLVHPEVAMIAGIERSSSNTAGPAGYYYPGLNQPSSSEYTSNGGGRVAREYLESAQPQHARQFSDSSVTSGGSPFDGIGQPRYELDTTETERRQSSDSRNSIGAVIGGLLRRASNARSQRRRNSNDGIVTAGYAAGRADMRMPIVSEASRSQSSKHAEPKVVFGSVQMPEVNRR